MDVDDLECNTVPSSSAENDNSFRNQTPIIRNSQNKKRKVQDEDDMECVPSQQPTGVIEKVWSEKEEIALLEVLKKRRDKSNMSRLYYAAKKHLDVDFSESQVTEKVHMLKTKFNNTSEEELPSGSHHATIYKLCKEIWGKINEPVVGGSQMTMKEFQARYPRINASLDDLPPYSIVPDEGKCVIKDCMLLLSPVELEDLENKWMAYYEREVERSTKHLLLKNKQSNLLQKGTRAYNQTHQN